MNSLNGLSRRPASTRLRCPKCRSRTFELVELIEASTAWTVIDGRLDFNEGIHEPGGCIGMWANCAKCKHGWRPRGWVNDLIATEALSPSQAEGEG